MEIRANTYDKEPILSTVSETGLPLRKPGELDGGGGHGLLAASFDIDRSLPVLVSKVAVDFEVFADPLDHLEVDVVQGGAARDKVLGGFLIAYPKLKPFIAAQVISNPALAALVFTANPVAEEDALVGVALFLDDLPILVLAVAGASGADGIGADGFDA